MGFEADLFEDVPAELKAEAQQSWQNITQGAP